MYEVNKSLATRWVASKGGGRAYVPTHIDLLCPNKECGRSLVNMSLHWAMGSSYAFCEKKCAACGDLVRFFLIDPPQSAHPEAIQAATLLVIPPQSAALKVEPQVQDISPAFVRIYHQAAKAELLDLDELAGMGYRKALEFLIKDYLVTKKPDKEDSIRKEFLSKCIHEHVEDTRIKETAELALWLGNDETHYVRRWPENDIEDLKGLIGIILHWIGMELATEEWQRKMRRR